jgi:hypothetical protein
MNRVVEKVSIIEHLNERSKKETIKQTNKKGVDIEKPFKEILKEEVARTNAASFVLVKDSEVEVDLIWQSLMLRNKLRINGGK